MKKPFENQTKRKMEALRGPGRSAPAARLSRRSTAKSEFPCHPWFILSALFSVSFAIAVVDEFGVRNSPFAFDLSVSKHTQNTPDFAQETQVSTHLFLRKTHSKHTKHTSADPLPLSTDVLVAPGSYEGGLYRDDLSRRSAAKAGVLPGWTSLSLVLAITK